MKLTINFSSLASAVKQMNPSQKGEFTSQTSIKPRDQIDIDLGNGIDVSLSEVESTAGLLSYKGRQVLLYIRDHGSSVRGALEDGSTGRKYHVADCKVLNTMREKGRFDRYVVTNDTSEQFFVTGTDKFTNEYLEGETDLKVCKVCLGHLNYKGYQSGGNRGFIFNQFTMDEFFSTFSSHFIHLPSKRADDIQDTYTPDWAQVSANYKHSKGYTCEKCSVDLSGPGVRQLLHTHHKDGVKTNNREPNLIALCADCHSKEAFHEHMFVSHKERQTIISLRKQQLIINDQNSWQELFDYADSAVHGVLHMCQRKRTSMPEVGLDIADQHSEIVATAELAWPMQKIAIVLDDEEKHTLQNIGWKSFRTDELIQNFERAHIN